MGSADSELARRRFVMERCLGRGGFGEVYQATQHAPGGLQTPVAVKVLRADLDLQADAVRRLRDEGRMLSRLNHPTILRVFDLVELEGRVALVTELVEGADLDACVGLSVRAAVQAIGSVAGALEAALVTLGPGGEPLALVHRDIKPSNVRVGRHGHVKLLDFGIARSDTMTREAQTESDLVVGSLPYMAPERFLAPGTDPSSDIFSLGCTLYEALAGERFFVDGQLRTLSGLALDPLRFETFLRERLDALAPAPPVRSLLVAMLSHDPEERPTCSELARQCEALADELPGPGLSLWAADAAWPEPASFDAPFVGRAITEGTLPAADSPPRTPDPGEGVERVEQVEPVVPEVAPLRSMLWVVLLGGTGALAAVFVGVGSVLVLMGVAGWVLLGS